MTIGVRDICVAVDRAIESGAWAVEIEANCGGEYAARFAEELLALRGQRDMTVTRTIRRRCQDDR